MNRKKHRTPNAPATVLAVAFLLAGASEAAQTYSFDHLAPGPIFGQDGWMAGGAVVEPSTNAAGLALRGSTWRNNDADFRFPRWTWAATNAVIGFDFFIFTNGGISYAKMLLAERDHGFAAEGTTGFAYDTAFSGFVVHRADGSGWAGGPNFPGAIGHWYRAEMRISFAAHSGNGSGSIFVKDLTAGQTNFTPVAALQNIGLLLANQGTDPVLFDQLIVQSANAQIDNLAAGPEAPWFGETFEPVADPASVAGVGWNVVSDTANPVAVTNEFAVNNAQNVIKVTRTNDALSTFRSGYVFVEHDVADGETTMQGNFVGQDCGDALLWTTKPLAKYQAHSLDLNGATFSVDYLAGNGVSGGGHFCFVVQTATGSWWTLQDATIPRPVSQVQHLSKEPIDAAVHQWKQILPGSGAGQCLRLADTPYPLSAAQLADVKAVGLYVRPTTLPSRFDNFQVLGFTVNPLPRLAAQRTPTNTLTLAWSNQPPNFDVYSRASAVTGAWQLVTVPVTETNGIKRATVGLTNASRFFILKRP